MGSRNFFLRIVKNEMQLLLPQPLPEDRMRQQMPAEHFQLQRIIQQIVTQAGLPEQHSALLSLIKNRKECAISAPGRLHDL